MEKKYFLLLILSAFLYTKHLDAQDTPKVIYHKPIAVEEFIGNHRQFFQIMVNKSFTEKNGTGLLSIFSYAADYQDKLCNNEYMSTTLVYHRLFSGISINSGVTFTSIDGLKNFIGLQYIYQNKTMSLIYIPGYYFINASKISNLALAEYKPSINDKWSFYTRLQMHYNHDLENGNHFRSYAYSRLGLTYKYFSFGLAHNIDRYGANKNTKNNYGVFLKLTL
jgi:hypothetical protein